MNDLELQKYLFDLQGYLVIENALGAGEVAALNRLIDGQNLPPPDKSPRFGSAPTLGSSLIRSESIVPDSMVQTGRDERVGSGFLDWGKSFCDLLDHPAIMPALRIRLGEAFRLDRIYGMYMRKGQGYGKLHADYGATAPNEDVHPGEYYAFRSDQIYEGFVVVAWALSDAGPGHGGFCCIPGSHKSNYKLPQQISDNFEEAPQVVIPEMPAGSVILFSEALTHGTATWQADHERRTLIYKYSKSHLVWTSRRVEAPTAVDLTPRQRILLREPGDPLRHFPSLFEADAV
ncbi:MAG: phytanoyl-CoA dioxygenase family protein [Anaerolineaceae bacterium]|nr:phytanoyl-CoA dioxygenase family protein [Anaerolineaceae bacterium]MDE0327783.1 phytanoyl-CoA dioxygenase family protein [Anaerolineaceae bacterium]